MRTFTSQEVLDLTEITYRQLSHWVSTGFVHINDVSPGTGHTRTFSYPETLRLMVLASLIHAGVTVRTASAHFARYGMHNSMTELVYQNGPVSITLDMRMLISKLES